MSKITAVLAAVGAVGIMSLGAPAYAADGAGVANLGQCVVQGGSAEAPPFKGNAPMTLVQTPSGQSIVSEPPGSRSGSQACGLFH